MKAQLANVRYRRSMSVHLACIPASIVLGLLLSSERVMVGVPGLVVFSALSTLVVPRWTGSIYHQAALAASPIGLTYGPVIKFPGPTSLRYLAGGECSDAIGWCSSCGRAPGKVCWDVSTDSEASRSLTTTTDGATTRTSFRRSSLRLSRVLRTS